MAGPAADWASEFGTSPAQSSGPVSSRNARYDSGGFMGAQSAGGGWASSFGGGMPHAAAMSMGQQMGPQVSPQQHAFEQTWQTAQAPHDWAEQFLQYDDTHMAEGKLLTAEQLALQETARQLLAQSADPKLKNSKFMSFVQKLGSGELTFADSDGKAASADWAQDFGAGVTTAAPRPQDLTAAWENAQATTAPGTDPFASAWDQSVAARPDWADAFGATEGGDWAEQFEGAGGAAAQAAAFEESWAEAARETGLQQDQQPPPMSEYVFEEHNPFLAEPASYDEALQNAKEALYGAPPTRRLASIEPQIVGVTSSM
jgi:hypothetical protein